MVADLPVDNHVLASKETDPVLVPDLCVLHQIPHRHSLLRSQVPLVEVHLAIWPVSQGRGLDRRHAQDRSVDLTVKENPQHHGGPETKEREPHGDDDGGPQRQTRTKRGLCLPPKASR